MDLHFRSRREPIEDDFRRGRPAIVTCFIKDFVKDMVNMDRRTTVRVIADELGVLCSKVHGILTEELGMSKVSARWVLRLLKDSQPRWLSWMRHPTRDQEVVGSTPAEVGNILSWRLILKYLLPSADSRRAVVSFWRMCTILVKVPQYSCIRKKYDTDKHVFFQSKLWF